MTLSSKISDRSAVVAVIGLGYVGIPLASAAARAGFKVIGIDLDEQRIEGLRSGRSEIVDVSSMNLSELVGSGRIRPTTDYREAADADVILICVPTPLRDEHPDMSHIESAGRELSKVLKRDQLVILESTTYPGTTDELLKQLLESSGLKAGEDFLLGFSPERINPGNLEFTIENVPKIVGGLNDKSGELMEQFYRSFIKEVVRVSSPKVAEMAKLLENTYRHVNIALANEIAILCNDLGIDVWEVIDAAATKPFGFQPFYPGPGWGGHCIPVDPAYLSWRVRQMGETSQFIELARQINQKMPAYVVQRIGDCLNEEGKSIKGSTVLLIGVAYKPDVSDIREAPAIEIATRLSRTGAKVLFHDPYVDHIETPDGYITRSDLNESLGLADVVVIVTDHSAYDWDSVASKAKIILDTRNALQGRTGRIVKL